MHRRKRLEQTTVIAVRVERPRRVDEVGRCFRHRGLELRNNVVGRADLAVWRTQEAEFVGVDAELSGGARRLRLPAGPLVVERTRRRRPGALAARHVDHPHIAAGAHMAGDRATAADDLVVRMGREHDHTLARKAVDDQGLIDAASHVDGLPRPGGQPPSHADAQPRHPTPDPSHRAEPTDSP